VLPLAPPEREQATKVTENTHLGNLQASAHNSQGWHPLRLPIGVCIACVRHRFGDFGAQKVAFATLAETAYASS